MYTFVTGGYRSGRSNYALHRAAELGPPPWLYVSAGQETDEAVRKRIQHHRRDAEAIWRTAVIPPRLLDLIEPPTLEGCGAAVFDGLSEWIEARILESSPNPAAEDAALLKQVAVFAEDMYRSSIPVVVTATERGLGMLPDDDHDLRVLRVVTSANQILAQQAGAVVLMVSGVPFKAR